MKHIVRLFSIAMVLAFLASLGTTPRAVYADNPPPSGTNSGAPATPPKGVTPPTLSKANSSVTGITDPAQICNASIYDFSDYAEWATNPPSFPGGTFSGTGSVRVVGSSWATWNPQQNGLHVLFATASTYDIIFTNPQQGVGLVAEPDTMAYSDVVVTAFDASNNNLGSFSLSITGNAGAAFLGMTSASKNIKKLTVSDSVDSFAFSDLTWGAKCLLANGGFNDYVGSSTIPQYWNVKNFKTTDGKNTTNVEEGSASVQIGARPAKTLSQAIVLTGVKGDQFDFSFWVMGLAIPKRGCTGQVMMYNGKKLVATKTIKCPAGTFAFRQMTLTFAAPSAYTELIVKFTYSGSKGTVWFDNAALWQP